MLQLRSDIFGTRRNGVIISVLHEDSIQKIDELDEPRKFVKVSALLVHCLS